MVLGKKKDIREKKGNHHIKERNLKVLLEFGLEF